MSHEQGRIDKKLGAQPVRTRAPAAVASPRRSWRVVADQPVAHQIAGASCSRRTLPLARLEERCAQGVGLRNPAAPFRQVILGLDGLGLVHRQRAQRQIEWIGVESRWRFESDGGSPRSAWVSATGSTGMSPRSPPSVSSRATRSGVIVSCGSGVSSGEVTTAPFQPGAGGSVVHKSRGTSFPAERVSAADRYRAASVPNAHRAPRDQGCP